MNMRNILLALLLTNSVHALHADKYTIVNNINKPEVFKVEEVDIDLTQAFTTYLKGSLIGAITGVGCHYTDQHMHVVPNWFIWMVLRQLSVRYMMADTKNRTEQNTFDDQILEYSALEASWISYFLCKTSIK